MTEIIVQSEVWPKSSPSISQNEDVTVGNSLGVLRELAEGIGSLLGWRKGVCRKKTKTHRKIVGVSRKACRELERLRE
ncbi:hypothetical protein GW17_00038514 [Ensete ventricosum]|nr:hypothetical protein GW17_00038514 [Ensete ventricosum]